MGAYIFKTTRTFIEVEGLGKVYLSKYAYKPSCGWDDYNEEANRRIVAPTLRAWEKAGEEPEYIIPMYSGKKSEVDGRAVYKSNWLEFYDDGFHSANELVGYVKVEKRGRRKAYLFVQEQPNAAN